MSDQEQMALELATLTVASDMAYHQWVHLRERREELGVRYHEKFGSTPEYWPIYIDWFKRVRVLVSEHADRAIPEATVEA